MQTWRKYVERYSVLCVSDGTYGLKLKSGVAEDAIRTILNRSEILEKVDNQYYRVKFKGIEIVIFKPTGTVILVALAEKYERLEEFLDELFKP